jgi:thiamine biosynthesis lipoprotein
MLLSPALVISACSKSGLSKYSYEFYGVFDTMIQLLGYAESEAQFEQWALYTQERLDDLNKLYNIYNDYPGINNIKTINDNAGVIPTEVAQEIIDMLVFGKDWYFKTGGPVNIALGPVLSIWHEYRDRGLSDPSSAVLPPIKLLSEAFAKTDLNKLLINKPEKTVFLEETGMSLDVGAIAKGYATEIVAQELEAMGMLSGILSSGGNVRIIGSPLDGRRNKFGIGIQDPDGNPLKPDDISLDTLYVSNTSVVTSGDYQRFYKVDGVVYHHLIDPATLMPASHFRSVTVMVKHSGLTDFLSSTVFIMPYEDGLALIDSIEDAEALWIFPDGSMKATDGMKASLKKMGGAKFD